VMSDTRNNSIPAAGLKINWDRMRYKQEAEHEREYWLYTFAGQAMQGLMTDKMIRDTLSVEGLAIEAVEQARALLALLEKEPTT
jgi:hypothetical protein